MGQTGVFLCVLGSAVALIAVAYAVGGKRAARSAGYVGITAIAVVTMFTLRLMGSKGDPYADQAATIAIAVTVVAGLELVRWKWRR